MEKPIQTDMQKCKMPAQIKSLSQKEVLLPLLEDKCALSLLDKNQEMFFSHEVSGCKGYTGKSCICNWFGAIYRDVLEVHFDKQII